MLQVFLFLLFETAFARPAHGKMLQMECLSRCGRSGGLIVSVYGIAAHALLRAGGRT
jgi:hypothetical protein